MHPKLASIIIGGLLPALILGAFGVMQKVCMRAGLGIGPFFVIVGATVFLFGLVWCLFTQSASISLASGLPAVLTGLLWSAGTALITLAIARYGANISQLVPLYNMNTLVVVVLGLSLFSEWKQVQPLPLVVGAVAIVLGAVLVARA